MGARSDPTRARTRHTRSIGRAVEDRVAAYLAARGMEIVARNVEIAGAELDLIGRLADASGETIVFVEVRSRATDSLGSPLETVDARKRRQLVRAATAWLTRERLWERTAVRFDVVGVVGELGHDEAPEIQWIAGAFDVDDG